MINTPTSEILSGMVFLPWVLGSCKLSSVLQLPDDDGVGRKIDFYLRRKRGPGRRRPIRVTLEKGGEMNPLHKSRAFFFPGRTRKTEKQAIIYHFILLLGRVIGGRSRTRPRFSLSAVRWCSDLTGDDDDDDDADLEGNFCVIFDFGACKPRHKSYLARVPRASSSNKP